MELAYNGAMRRDFRINVRIIGEEAERFGKVYDRIMSKTMGQARMTNIILELIGMRPQYLTNDEDRRILAHGTLAPVAPSDEVPVGRRGRPPRKIQNG